MAASSVDARSNDERTATLTVPAAYADRFRHETLFLLGAAGNAMYEAFEWAEKKIERGEKPGTRPDPDEFDRLHEAERVFLQAREQGGELSIEAKVATLASAAQGCENEAADAVQVAVTNLQDDVLPAIAELEFWHALCVEFGGREPEEHEGATPRRVVAPDEREVLLELVNFELEGDMAYSSREEAEPWRAAARLLDDLGWPGEPEKSSYPLTLEPQALERALRCLLARTEQAIEGAKRDAGTSPPEDDAEFIARAGRWRDVCRALLGEEE